MFEHIRGLNILVTILTDLSFATVVGVWLAEWWLGRDPIGGIIPLRRLGITSLVILVLSQVVRPLLLAASMSGSTDFGEIRELVPTVLSSTRQGVLWYSGGAAIVCVFLTSFFGTTWSNWMRVAGLSVFAAVKAASSHASEGGDYRLPEIAEFLHLLATSVWAGAVLVSGFVVVPRLNRLVAVSHLWSYGQCLSRTVTWALAVLLSSGLYTSWSDTHGEMGRLVTSDWGKTLIVKVMFAGGAALLGSVVRFRCLMQPANVDRATSMVRLLHAEAVFLACTVFASGVLANSNPTD